jgi:transcriptional regulator with GAF, ATPase, and Fis domain
MRVEDSVDLGAAGVEQTTDKNAARIDDVFRRKIEEIANQLCLTIGGNFDHLVRVEAHDDTVEKLEMVVNFVLATASRSIEEVKQAKAQLEQQLDIRRKLERENAYLREEETRALGEFIGRSPPVRHLSEQIAVVAPTNATVLILGESGTGKELVAREIHKASSRRDGSMVRVNCAAVPRDLFESEFFGHVKGAFTGAFHDRVGRFELANGGTLFLDEVGEIPIELQSKLLRAIQEGEYERVGGNKTLNTDVRLVAATNRNLAEEVRKGKFREDLYYRLNVFPITLAPLRERKSDIAPLAAHFLERACKEFNKPLALMSGEALAALKAYDWPGNVRELQNVVERAVITTRGGPIFFELPTPPAATQRSERLSNSAPVHVRTEQEVRDTERANVLAALNKTRWKVYGRGGAAELLGIKPGTLAARMKKLGLRRPS